MSDYGPVPSERSQFLPQTLGMRLVSDRPAILYGVTLPKFFRS